MIDSGEDSDGGVLLGSDSDSDDGRVDDITAPMKPLGHVPGSGTKKGSAGAVPKRSESFLGRITPDSAQGSDAGGPTSSRRQPGSARSGRAAGIPVPPRPSAANQGAGIAGSDRRGSGNGTSHQTAAATASANASADTTSVSGAGSTPAASRVRPGIPPLAVGGFASQSSMSFLGDSPMAGGTSSATPNIRVKPLGKRPEWLDDAGEPGFKSSKGASGGSGSGRADEALHSKSARDMSMPASSNPPSARRTLSSRARPGRAGRSDHEVSDQSIEAALFRSAMASGRSDATAGNAAGSEGLPPPGPPSSGRASAREDLAPGRAARQSAVDAALGGMQAGLSSLGLLAGGDGSASGRIGSASGRRSGEGGAGVAAAGLRRGSQPGSARRPRTSGGGSSGGGPVAGPSVKSGRPTSASSLAQLTGVVSPPGARPGSGGGGFSKAK